MAAIIILSEHGRLTAREISDKITRYTEDRDSVKGRAGVPSQVLAGPSLAAS